jgi:hypothetical protein
MFFIYGTRFFGRVDTVPGHFQVATKFAHVYLVPLIPVESWLVLAEDGNSVRGMKIPLSARSVFTAYLRTALFLLTVGSVIALFCALDGHNPYVIGRDALLAVGAFAGLCVTMRSNFFNRASYRRAVELCRHLGMDEEGIDALRQIYPDAVAPRQTGFDVLPAGAQHR